MKKEVFNSGLLFGLIVFVAFLPLTFVLSGDNANLLIGTTFRYFVWCVQVIVLLILLLTGWELSRRRLIGSGILCLMIPFVCTFDEHGISFLILTNYASTVLSWLMAITLFSRLFVLSRQKAEL